MATFLARVYKVALLGFSEFERNALGVCFRLGGAHGPAYALTQKPAEADFLLVDCDHRPSVEWVQVTDRTAMAVYIGVEPPDEALSWMSRPIDPLQVMRELESMAAISLPALAPDAASVADSAAAAVPDAGFEPFREPVRVAPVAPVLHDTWQPETQPGWEPEWPPGWRPQDAPADTPAPPPPARAAPPAPPTAVPTQRKARTQTRDTARPRVPLPQTALVVDDSEVGSRFLQRKLEGWGLQVECASASRQALAMLDHRSYDLIFIDVELGPSSDLDGLALCQRIKQSGATVAADVVVVSAHQGEIDRARGALAGCDAYLGKPLRDAELAPLLLRRGLVQTSTVPAPV